MIKPQMQFSLKAKRTISIQPIIEKEVFGELQTERDIENRLQQLQEQHQQHQLTQSSCLSQQSIQDMKQNNHQMLETYAYLVKEMINNKDLQYFCNSFGFSVKDLEQIKKPEERENYVITQMCNHIKDLTQKVELRMHQYKLDEWITLQQCNQKLNIFEWLEVKSKYIHLKKKLQYALIDAIQQDSITKQQEQQRKRTISQSNTSQLSRASTTILTNRRRLTSIQEIVKLNPNIEKTQQVKSFQGEWNEQLESQYQTKGKNQKILGLYPVIQKAILENVGLSVMSKQRNQLLTKYSEGGCLTSEEMKFIATTSQLLNSCSDKEFLQKTINYLDKSIIDQIETNIAENILETFTQITDEVKQIRQLWLKKFSKQIEQQVKDTHFSVLRKLQLSQSQKQLEKVKIKMISIFKDVQKEHQKKLQAELDKDQFIQSQTGVKKVILKFKDKIMKKVKTYRKNRILGIERKFLDRNLPPKSKMLFKINKEMKSTEYVQRLFHPPSKLLIPNEGSKTERAIQEENKYKVRSTSTIRKQDYKQYISGGPNTERNYASSILRKQTDMIIFDQKPRNSWITNEIEIQAINKIKAAIRAYIQRKKYIKEKQQKEQQQQHSQNLISTLKKQSPEKIKQIENEVISFIKGLTLNKQKSQSTVFSSKQRLQSDMKLKTRKLFQAAKKKCLNIAVQSGFIFSKEEVNQRDEYGRTPLSYSAENGDEQICHYFIRLGANINIPDYEGMTPTHYIFKSNYIPLIMRFLNLGANLNLLTKDGLTPIAFANQMTIKKLNLQSMISSGVKGQFDNHALLNKKYPKYYDIIESLELQGNFTKI